MANVGLSVGLENAWLNTLLNVPFVVGQTCIKLHVGIPGADGTANPSAVTTRVAAPFASASGGGMSLTGSTPMWDMTASEVLTHISVWSGFSGDVDAIFLWSSALKVAKTVASGDQFSLAQADLSFTVEAA